MRILYLYQYFSTQQGSWGTRAYEFARRWVKAGHRVTVVTSVYDRSDLRPRGLVERFDVEGIEVVVVNVLLSNKHGLVKRLVTFAQFLIIATWISARTPADVTLASSGPLTIGIPALLARILRRRKFVFEMRDIFSEGVWQIGAVKRAFLYRRLKSLELFFCRHADAVVALSPGIAEWVTRHGGPVSIVVVPNAADNELFGSVDAGPRNEEVIRAVFTGTIGTANNCGLITEAASVLRRRGANGIRIELIGDGKERPRLEQEAAARGLDNVVFRDLMPKVELAKQLAGAHIALLVLRPIPVFDTASPNKLFDALAAGLPVIQTTQGWIKELLAQEDCGVTTLGNDPTALADAIWELAQDPARRARMGANAKRIARERFDRDRLADELLSVLQAVAPGRALARA
jgi:glycosyltransferase involved in cell wall biosynthesis